MFKEPAGAGLPGNTAPVHDVCRKIHTGMVVKVTGFHQHGGKLVDAGDARFGFRNVTGQFLFILAGIESRLVGLDVIPDPVGMREIYPLPVIPPGKLLNKFLGFARIAHGGDGMIANLVKAQDPMPDVGRKAGHGPIEMVAAGGIGMRINFGQCRKRGPASALHRVG